MKEDDEDDPLQEPPPLSHALKILRVVLDLPQQTVAGRMGVSDGLVSDIERGRKDPEQKRLHAYLKALDLGPEMIDRTLAFRQEVRSSVPAGAPADPREAERRERVRLAGEAGRALEDSLLRLLDWLMPRLSAYQERRRAPDLWARLRRHRPDRRNLLVRESREYQSWGLAEYLCAESLAAAAADAHQAVELAELAVLVARHAQSEERLRKRVEGYCWFHLASARRVRNDLAGAEQASATAWPLWREGAAGEPGLLNEARVLGLEASLHRAQRRFGRALELLEQAFRVDRGEERPYLLINRANTLEDKGDLEDALEDRYEVESCLNSESEPRLAFIAESNLVYTLSLLEHYKEAERKLPKAQALGERAAAKGLDLVRLLWVRGRVAAGLGREEEALAALEQVRGEFAARDMPFDRALVSLELATLHLERGRTREVKDLAREMAPVFQAEGIHREALAALTLFRQAVEQERATAELARRVVRYLHRARHNPELRFEPEPPPRRGRPRKERQV